MKLRLTALLVIAALPLSTLGSTYVISDRQLTEGSLIGPIASTPQLRREMTVHEALLVNATVRLGLTRSDFAAVRQEIDLGRARYVALPRHLDGMAGEHGGVPFVVRDVVIPAHVYGWEVDLQKPDGLVRVFVPNRCGNISYVFVPRRFRVAAASYPSPLPPPPVAPTPAPPLALATPAPTAVPIAVAQAPVVAGHPHLGWLPFLALPLIFAFTGHHGTSNHLVPVPAPVHTACPTLLTIRM